MAKKEEEISITLKNSTVWIIIVLLVIIMGMLWIEKEFVFIEVTPTPKEEFTCNCECKFPSCEKSESFGYNWSIEWNSPEIYWVNYSDWDCKEFWGIHGEVEKCK